MTTPSADKRTTEPIGSKAGATGGNESPGSTQHGSTRSRTPIVVAAIALLLVVALVGYWLTRRGAAPPQEAAAESSTGTVSFLMEQTLKKYGDLLTRENLMRQAANHQKLRVPLLLPGITVSTSPTDFYPVQSVQLQRFKGETWELFGEVMSAESA